MVAAHELVSTYESCGARRDGAQGRNRTTDTRIFSPLLYQLSYLGRIFEGRVIGDNQGPVQRSTKPVKA